jgi:hypothetical protein
MSVNIESNGDITTISCLDWSIPLYFKDGKFFQFGVPTYQQEFTYTVRSGTYYDEHKTTFAMVRKGNHMDSKEPCPVIDFGKIDEDGGLQISALIWVIGNECRTRCYSTDLVMCEAFKAGTAPILKTLGFSEAEILRLGLYYPAETNEIVRSEYVIIDRKEVYLTDDDKRKYVKEILTKSDENKKNPFYKRNKLVRQSTVTTTLY